MIAPKVGTKISAYSIDADSVAIKVIGMYFMNSPTIPGQNSSGENAAIRVRVEEITGPAYTVAWQPDGKRIASAGFDGKVWLHDAETGKRVKEFVAVPLTLKTASK